MSILDIFSSNGINQAVNQKLSTIPCLCDYKIGSEPIYQNEGQKTLIYPLVKRGIFQKDVKKSIIKLIYLEKGDEDEIEAKMQEAVFMDELAAIPNHNVVPITTHFLLFDKNNPMFYCVVEDEYYVLDDYIKSSHPGISLEELAVRLCVDITNVLWDCQIVNPAYIIVHRDLKFQNIFFKIIKKGLLLADFGIARRIRRGEAFTDCAGSFSMSPEVMFKQKVNQQCDIYSLGEMMYYLLNNRKALFGDIDNLNVKDYLNIKCGAIKNAYAGKAKLHHEPPANGSDRLKKLVMKAVELDPKDRWKTAFDMFEELSETKEFKRIYADDSKYLEALSFYRNTATFTHIPWLQSESQAKFIYCAKATVFCDDGSVYCGTWKYGLKNGDGESLSISNILTKGTWEDGKTSEVIEEQLTAEKAREWRMNARSSIQKQRIYHISDGNIPDGDNITVVLNNSEIYSGRFENGMMHGEGWIIQKVDGKIVFSIGRWENGIKCGKFLEITKENGRTVSKVINKWENGRCYTLKYIF